jgi:hypothetical protein
MCTHFKILPLQFAHRVHTFVMRDSENIARIVPINSIVVDLCNDSFQFPANETEF